jgi:hypothetical protein
MSVFDHVQFGDNLKVTDLGSKKIRVDAGGGGAGGGGGTPITVQDEGVALTQRAILNFIGAGVTAADDAPNLRTNVTIPGGGGSSYVAYDTVQEEGTALTQRRILNFIGNGVTATDDAASLRTNITLPDSFAFRYGTPITSTYITLGPGASDFPYIQAGSWGGPIFTPTGSPTQSLTVARKGIIFATFNIQSADAMAAGGGMELSPYIGNMTSADQPSWWAAIGGYCVGNAVVCYSADVGDILRCQVTNLSTTSTIRFYLNSLYGVWLTPGV